MFCRFRPQKKRFRGKSCQAYSFKIKKNVQDIKGVEVLRLQYCYLKILNFWNFDAKNKKHFFIYLPKNQKGFRFAKHGIYMIALTNFFSHTKFQIDISFLAKLQRKNCKKLITSNFETQFLAILDHVAQNKDHHQTRRDELHRFDTHFMKKYQLLKLTFFDLILT